MLAGDVLRAKAASPLSASRSGCSQAVEEDLHMWLWPRRRGSPGRGMSRTKQWRVNTLPSHPAVLLCKALSLKHFPTVSNRKYAI